MDNIILPSTVQFSLNDNPNITTLSVTPCHQGYGTTLGNALRRVLLSSLPGSAVEFVKIDGVQHEFSAIDGVQEDMIEVILNLKQMVVASHSASPVTLTLRKKGVGPITAGDFEKNADVDVINPEHVLMTVTDAKKEINMEIVVGNGRGYVPVSEKDTKHVDLGMIGIDSLYSPIRDIGYKVENTRVGDVTDYEALTVTINTDGSITGKDATHMAAKILMDHLQLVLQAAEDDVASVQPPSEAPQAEDAPSEEAPAEEEASDETPEEAAA